jgi:hypothetical protein
MKTPVAAIDVHAHNGDYVHANALLRRFSGGTPAEVVDRARACGVAWTKVMELDRFDLAKN